MPTLLAWAALVAATSAVAGALVPPGASLTLYFSGAAVLVVWLERRARSLLACHSAGAHGSRVCASTALLRVLGMRLSSTPWQVVRFMLCSVLLIGRRRVTAASGGPSDPHEAINV